MKCAPVDRAMPMWSLTGCLRRSGLGPACVSPSLGVLLWSAVHLGVPSLAALEALRDLVERCRLVPERACLVVSGCIPGEAVVHPYPWIGILDSVRGPRLDPRLAAFTYQHRIEFRNRNGTTPARVTRRADYAYARICSKNGWGRLP